MISRSRNSSWYSGSCRMRGEGLRIRERRLCLCSDARDMCETILWGCQAFISVLPSNHFVDHFQCYSLPCLETCPNLFVAGKVFVLRAVRLWWVLACTNTCPKKNHVRAETSLLSCKNTQSAGARRKQCRHARGRPPRPYTFTTAKEPLQVLKSSENLRILQWILRMRHASAP